MIQQTVERLSSLAPPQDMWVLTNHLLSDLIANQLPELKSSRILCEPVARNTAPACALAAFLMERMDPDTVIGMFPSDHVVKDPVRFAEVMSAGINLASTGNKIIVLGVPPWRAETGYGYVELGGVLETDATTCGDVQVRKVRRFTEKPTQRIAEQFVASGNYAWNSGIFLWRAKTLTNAIREYCPAMAPYLETIAAAYDTPSFPAVFAAMYPECEGISIDYAVLEPRSAMGEEAAEIYCLPADFGWNDLGSWQALHEHKSTEQDHPGEEHCNVIESAGSVVIRARGSYVYAPGKTVALVGVENIVVVQTDDALLITTRSNSQEVSKVVRLLAESGRRDLT